AARDAARRRLPARRRYALPQHRDDRGTAGRADRAHRHAVLPLAVRSRAEALVMLEVRQLAFGFPGHTVGRDVTFSLATGEVMCVLGPNGGGKTTLFRTVLGLLDRQSGSVELDGRPLESLSRAEVAQLAGYVPQGHSAYFAFTLREFVLMGRTS